MFTLPTSVKTLFVAYLLTTGTLFANPTNPVKPASFNTSLYVTKANKIRVAVEKLTVDPVVITLRSLGDGGVSVFTQSMSKKQTKLALQLDVSGLADGVYELEIKSATGQLVKQLTLATPAPKDDITRRIVLPAQPMEDAVVTVK